MRNLICIVLFHPVRDQVLATVGNLRAADGQLVMFWNSPFDADLVDACAAISANPIIHLGTGENIGLGAAYNIVFAEGVRRGTEAVLLLDQDSLPPAGMLDELNRRLSLLRARGMKPAVVAPNPVVADQQSTKISRHRKDKQHAAIEDMVAVEFVISSGSLIPYEAFAIVGPFKAEFFIDAIDIDWCLRARAEGLECWLARDVRMPHRLGSGVIQVPLLNMLLVRQPPKRIYTFIRNQLLMVRHSRASIAWRCRAVFRVLVHSVLQPALTARRIDMTKWVYRGWRDAFLGRTGRP